MWKSSCVCALLVAAGTSSAPQDYSMMGMGTATCSELTAVGRGPAEQSGAIYFVLAWAQGFISGINFQRMHVGDSYKNMAGIAVEDQIDRLQTFCKDRPTARIADAVLDLYGALPKANPSRP